MVQYLLRMSLRGVDSAGLAFWRLYFVALLTCVELYPLCSFYYFSQPIYLNYIAQLYILYQM